MKKLALKLSALGLLCSLSACGGPYYGDGGLYYPYGYSGYGPVYDDYYGYGVWGGGGRGPRPRPGVGPGGVPVVMVAPVALAPVHAPAAEVVVVRLVVVLVAVVIPEAVAVREVMEALAAAPVAVVTDNLAKAAFFKV